MTRMAPVMLETAVCVKLTICQVDQLLLVRGKLACLR